jgi:hypothetical protein
LRREGEEVTECEENRGGAKRTNSKCVYLRECILEERGRRRREEKRKRSAGSNKKSI